MRGMCDALDHCATGYTPAINILHLYVDYILEKICINFQLASDSQNEWSRTGRGGREQRILIHVQLNVVDLKVHACHH